MSRFWSDLTNSDAFTLGLVLGAAALVVGILVAGLVRRGAPPNIGGYLYSAAAIATLGLTFDVPWAVPAGAALVAAACQLGDDIWDRALGSLFGAGLLVIGGDVADGAGAVVLVVSVAVCAALVVAFDQPYRRSAIGLPLLAASTFGVLLTVPDTERAMALFGVALPMILLGWPGRFVSLGAGAGAAVALIGWVGGIAGAARPGATVGSLAALGLMLAAPLGMRITRVATPALARVASSGPGRALIVVAIHGVMVFGASRVAGLQQSAALAAVIAAPFLAVGMVVGAAPAPVSEPTTVER
ncbi:MAG TPA: hypothetical protein VLG28_18910 [Acidimicrobiia bacterium]|jgi:hypothetical protein|nr:hypothetical protein [Acidimicrobiia bacterium]